MRTAMVTALALALSGCAHDRGSRGGETITYSLSGAGICLACASYAITLGPDGQGIFVGQRNTTKLGEQRFHATPKQVRRFAAQLRPYHAHGEVLMDRAPLCTQIVTDDDSVDIRWQSAVAPPAHLLFYGGCDAERNRKMRAALFSAPSLLPIAALIGRH